MKTPSAYFGDAAKAAQKIWQHQVDGGAFHATIIELKDHVKERGVGKTLSAAGTDLAMSVPVIFSTGDFVCALAKAEWTGIVANGAVLSATAGCSIYETLTGNKKGLGYLPLLANQVWTGGSITVQGIRDYGPHQFFTAAAQARETVETAALFVMAIPATGLMALKEAGMISPDGGFVKKTLLNPMSWAAVAGVIATTDHPVSAALFASGLAAVLTTRGDAPSAGQESMLDHVAAQCTPEKLIGDGYLATSIPLAYHGHPFLAASVLATAWALWGAGFHALARGETIEAGADTSIKITPRNFLSRNILADAAPLQSRHWPIEVMGSRAGREETNAGDHIEGFSRVPLPTLSA